MMRKANEVSSWRAEVVMELGGHKFERRLFVKDAGLVELLQCLRATAKFYDPEEQRGVVLGYDKRQIATFESDCSWFIPAEIKAIRIDFSPQNTEHGGGV